jgi:hypothetical protein
MRAWRHRGNSAVPGTTRLGRLLRGHRPDRNPLRRGSDRAETAMLGLLLAAFLAGAPFAAHLAGSWTYAMSARQAQAQQATVRQVSATLLQSAPSNFSGYGSQANARWKAPDGQMRTGPVFVPDGSAAGSTVMVWVTTTGQLTEPPLQRSQITGRTELSEALAVAVLAVTLCTAGLVGRRLLDRHRLAAWDAEWLATGPRWSPGGRTPGNGD